MFITRIFCLTAVLYTLSANALPLPRAPKNLIALPALFTTNFNFEGIVALNNCSGSLVRFENSLDTDKAMVLTNGHCNEQGFIEAGHYLVNVASDRAFDILDGNGRQIGFTSATKIIYGTMTRTDMLLYELGSTYAQILGDYGVKPLTLASQHPTVGQNIEVVSGFWKRGYSCQIEAFINALREDGWEWADSMRYSRPGCEVIGGTSGSPVVLAGARIVLGINNTGNEDGDRCTENNPCEVDKNGNVTVTQGYSYAQETVWLYSCLNKQNAVDLSTPGCLLPH